MPIQRLKRILTVLTKTTTLYSLTEKHGSTAKNKHGQSHGTTQSLITNSPSHIFAEVWIKPTLADRMPYETAIIPPVRAGWIESELDFEYDHEGEGKGGFEATGVHEWQFDMGAYDDLTGLHIGGDCPYVAQENGHSLRIVTDYKWNHSTYNNEDSYTLSIEEVAYRGTTRQKKVYWTMGGYYELDKNLRVERIGQEPQQYAYRERSDEHIPHRKVADIKEYVGYTGEQVVRKLHTGVLGPTVCSRLDDLIQADSPDDAIQPETYQQSTDSSPTSADDLRVSTTDSQDSQFSEKTDD
jgi:hypothetical protein